MTVARDAGSCFIAGYLASFVTRPFQRGIEFAADQLFDELTRPSPYLSLDRIEPVFEKINNRAKKAGRPEQLQRTNNKIEGDRCKNHKCGVPRKRIRLMAAALIVSQS